MILDSSAIIAAIVGERDAPAVLQAVTAARRCAIGAPTLLETGMVLISRFGPSGRTRLVRFCDQFSIERLAFTDEHHRTALDAFQQFGKGRHPASLNFGHCLSYATARVARQPLLCIGNDFVQTDLEVVALR